MIFVLALRNIVRNRKNSAVIMLLIGVIAALFFIGNSVFTRAARGLRRSYADNLTGDIIIEKKTDVTMNLFGANAPVIEEFFTIPLLAAHDAIRDRLRGFPEIAASASQVSVRCYIEAAGQRETALVCGVDAAEYFKLFPGITVEQGRLLEAGEYGAMITRARADRIAAGGRLEIGAPLLFTSGGDTGFKIREVPLVGIYSYRAGSALMNEVVIADAQTARVLAAVQVATSDVQVAADKTSLLDDTMLSLDDLFAADQSDGQPDTASSPSEALPLEDALTFMLGEAAGGSAGGSAGVSGGRTTGGDWHFIILRLKEGSSAPLVISALNEALAPFDALALDWRFAGGGSAILVLLLQALFNAGLVLAGLAGVIAIINIMLIAVFRRTREIGTLRAIGAGGSYIRALILCENSVIGLLAGFTGIALGLVVLRVVNALQIHIGNELLASLFGGEVLRIDFSPLTALASVAASLVLTVIASAYPVETAVRIGPADAIRAA